MGPVSPDGVREEKHVHLTTGNGSMQQELNLSIDMVSATQLQL